MTKPKASWSFRCLPKSINIDRVMREGGLPRGAIVQCGSGSSLLFLTHTMTTIADCQGLLRDDQIGAACEFDGKRYVRITNMTEDAFIELVVKTRALEKEVVRTRVVVL